MTKQRTFIGKTYPSPENFTQALLAMLAAFRKCELTNELNYLINHKGVSRTAPATPGLLITSTYVGFPSVTLDSFISCIFMSQNLVNML